MSAMFSYWASNQLSAFWYWPQLSCFAFLYHPLIAQWSVQWSLGIIWVCFELFCNGRCSAQTSLWLKNSHCDRCMSSKSPLDLVSSAVLFKRGRQAHVNLIGPADLNLVATHGQMWGLLREWKNSLKERGRGAKIKGKTAMVLLTVIVVSLHHPSHRCLSVSTLVLCVLSAVEAIYTNAISHIFIIIISRGVIGVFYKEM